MILACSVGITAAAQAETSVKFFRWNQGYRAQPEASFEWKTNDEEFSRFLKKPELAKQGEDSPLYAGCYLVEKQEGRTLASLGEEQRLSLFRVCLR
jgi:hypothetical protein